MNPEAAAQRALPELAAVRRRLGAAADSFHIDIIASCDSSNAVLLERAAAGAADNSVVVAVQQSAGRGRRGRSWLSAAGDSLTFSLLRRFPASRPVDGLSLAVGVAICEALAALGVAACLKWPNDVLVAGGKVAGVLVELQQAAPAAAVIGVGVNLALPTAMPPSLRSASAALGAAMDVNALLAQLLLSQARLLQDFADGGFASVCERWLQYCAHLQRAVVISSEGGPVREGLCCGVDADGALLLQNAAGGVERILAGDVSLRPA